MPAQGGRPSHAAVAAGLVYFALVFAAGFALGVVRTLWLEPAVGAVWAVALELPWMLAIAWWVCGRVLRALRVPRRTGARALTGGLALGLLLGVEVALGVVRGGAPGDVLRGLGRAERALGLAGQVAFGLFPLLRGSRLFPDRREGPGDPGP